jgi:MFS family permease
MHGSNHPKTDAALTRRSFLKNTSTAVAGGALLGALPVERFALGASPGDTVRIALVGAGGRGSGAADQALKAGGEGVRLVAVADAFGVVGAGVATFGGQHLFLVVYLLGIMLMGVGQGGTNLARYAAADLAEPQNRGKAISWIVFGSTVGAVGGPALVGVAGDVAGWFDLDELVGPFLFSTVFFTVAGLILWVGLRPDPLVVSGGLHTADSTDKAGFFEGLTAIMSQPMAQVATVSLVLSQAVMVMIMAMTPLHMDAHGHGLGAVGWVISVHTAGMFAFAPVAGWSSDRFGRLPTLAFGGAVLVAATVLTALAGEAPALLMFPGLYLLGLGWSFGVVAASALLTESVPDDSQVAAQGSADLITSFASGTGALASGFVFTMAGFHILSAIGIVASGIMLVTSLYCHRTSVAAAT